MARLLVVLLFFTLPVSATDTVPGGGALLMERAFPGTLLSGIRRAHSSIICAYYLFKVGRGPHNLPLAVVGELTAARRRGVAVTVILEGKDPVGRDNRKTGVLLARGGVRVLFPAGRGVSHLKAMVIDDRLVILGSHNLSQAALSANHELSVALDAPLLAREVRGYLERLSARSSSLAGVAP